MHNRFTLSQLLGLAEELSFLMEDDGTMQFDEKSQSLFSMFISQLYFIIVLYFSSYPQRVKSNFLYKQP